jgi:dTDP-4-amino-4,6-dideoxygalactose transaminase
MAGARHVYHIYAIRVQDRDEVIRSLAAKGIECGVHYPVPIHLQEAYRSIGYRPGAFPIAERCARKFISLPIFPELSPSGVEMIAQEVKQAVAASSIRHLESETLPVLVNS